MRSSTLIECENCDTPFRVPTAKIERMPEDTVVCPFCGDEIDVDDFKRNPDDDDE